MEQSRRSWHNCRLMSSLSHNTSSLHFGSRVEQSRSSWHNCRLRSVSRTTSLHCILAAEAILCNQQTPSQGCCCSARDPECALHHTTITLHPIVCYYQCADCEKGVVCETLAFISDDKVHDFHAVQTFVCLAMEHLRGCRQLDVQRVIQWTDGCASQYKSKGPFSDISHATSELDCVQLERHLFGLRHSLIKHHVDSDVKLNQAVVSDTKEMFEYLQQSFTKDPPGPCSHSRRVYFLDYLLESFTKDLPGPSVTVNVCSYHVRDGEIGRPRLDRIAKTIAGTRNMH